ncbi:MULTISPECIES: DUF5678 domain-containing protein [unclassified Flavobacterium]|jgi:hypothetical protein|uniref:DUF5678 domain-containing protein n=1 Tax=unclassified Flavobacterium TaxID=196869 RepID=UPI0025BAD502|nr:MULTISPECIES: DUF5678 domain-containing protein [unclassified Flavobacterium]
MECLEEIIEDKDILFVATEIGTDSVIASGNDADIVIKEAEKTGKEYIISYIPSKNHTFIF